MRCNWNLTWDSSKLSKLQTIYCDNVSDTRIELRIYRKSNFTNAERTKSIQGKTEFWNQLPSLLNQVQSRSQI